MPVKPKAFPRSIQRWFDGLNRARVALGVRPATRKEFLKHKAAIDDDHDPIRYVLAVPLGAKTMLYHRVEDAAFGSHISQATLFKRKKAADAVRKSMDSPRTRKTMRVVQVKKTKSGVRLVDKLKFL